MLDAVGRLQGMFDGQRNTGTRALRVPEKWAWGVARVSRKRLAAPPAKTPQSTWLFMT